MAVVTSYVRPFPIVYVTNTDSPTLVVIAHVGTTIPESLRSKHGKSHTGSACSTVRTAIQPYVRVYYTNLKTKKKKNPESLRNKCM